MELRPYQVRLIEEARAEMQKGVRSIMIQAATGAGKTCLIAHMLKTARARGLNSIFVVHRRELIRQSIKTFGMVGLPFGVLSPDFPEDLSQQVQIASVLTLGNRLQKIKRPSLIVLDEAHHHAAKTWSKITDTFPEAYLIGVSATPRRGDGKGLGRWYKSMLHGPPVADLIRDGYLSKYRVFAPGNGEQDKPTITGDAIREYRQRIPGRRAIVFAHSLEHSKFTVEEFKKAGFRAAHVDGESDSSYREDMVTAFEAGRLDILSNVNIFSEGVSVDAIESVIDLAPTLSLPVWLQRCGRALRPAPGKEEAIILDHAGNCERHGLPDEPREWILEGSGVAKKDDGSGPSLRICKKCFAAQFPGSATCQYCGHAFEIKQRKVQRQAGVLREMTPEALAAQRAKAAEKQRRAFEQHRAGSYEELVELGRRRNYVNPESWALFVWNGRKSK